MPRAGCGSGSAAPPVEGAANESLVRVLAAALDVPRSGVVIESGAASRVKRVRVDLDVDVVQARWPGVTAS